MARRRAATFLQVLRATRKVTNDPAFTGDKTELATLIAEEVMGCDIDKSTEFGWDLSELLALIEKWLPLILQLLAIF